MAEHSGSQPSADRLEEVLVCLTQQLLHLTSKIDELLTHVSPRSQPSFPPQPIHTQFPPRPPIPASHHRIKLEVPRFDGTDLLGWIFKINQFFEFHDTTDHDHLTIARFYMEGRALAWFQWMSSNEQFTSWPIFLQALQTRFAPSQYEDPTGTLFKLT